MVSTECDNIYGELVTGPHDFCVKDDFREDGLQSVCMGDSGSPALIDGKQIGLNSWGPGDCDPRYPTVLTSVPFYHDWIAEQCPQCVDEPESHASKNTIERARSLGTIGENMMFDMDRVVVFEDGASGHPEAVSVRDLVFLGLEIAGLLILSVVSIVLVYRRFTVEKQAETSESNYSVLFGKEERKPLLNIIEV